MAVSTAISGSSQALLDMAGAGPIRYFGFTIRETAAATAVVRIREGGVTGAILDTISLAANESSGDWYGPQGIVCNSDILYVQVVSGAVEGSIRHE